MHEIMDRCFVIPSTEARYLTRTTSDLICSEIPLIYYSFEIVDLYPGKIKVGIGNIQYEGIKRIFLRKKFLRKKFLRFLPLFANISSAKKNQNWSSIAKKIWNYGL